MFAIITVALLILLDQVVKYATYNFLRPVETISIIDNFFSLTYVENRGAAFGIFQGRVYAFAILTIIIVIILIFYYRRLEDKFPNKYLKFSLLLIIAGALGNLIDRLFRGFVVDMLQVTFIDFPVFNFADIYVVIGSIMLVVVTLLFVKD